MDPIERHIKKHFDNKSYPYNESHWLEARQLISDNNRKKRRWFLWWTTGVSVIIIIVLAFQSYSTESTMVTFNDIENLASSEDKDAGNTSTSVNGFSVNSEINAEEKPASARPDDSNVSGKKSQEQLLSAGTERQKVKSTVKSKETRTTYKNNARNEALVDASEYESSNTQEAVTPKSIDNDIPAPAADKALFSEKEGITSVSGTDASVLENSEQSSAEEPNPESAENILPAEQPLVENSESVSEVMPITPVRKRAKLGWGFVAGYLMQKQFTQDQWLKGAYFGARISRVLSSKWSVGTDVSVAVQEVNAVHFHHNAISGYGFGRDSIVTDLFAKRAITLQIPITLSYAIGKHTFAGMIGTRILLDAQASMQKLYYTNADPEDTSPTGIVPRSRIISKKEQLMPVGAVSPFSIYSGLRYGWMIGKGWGLETNISVPLYHRSAKLDFGTRIAADQGLRLEVGLLKVF